MNVHLLAVKTAVSSLSTNSILSSQGVHYTSYTPYTFTSDFLVGRHLMLYRCPTAGAQGLLCTSTVSWFTALGGTGCTCIHAIRCSKLDLRCQHYACYQWQPSMIMGWCNGLSPTVYSHVWENGYTIKGNELAKKCTSTLMATLHHL